MKTTIITALILASMWIKGYSQTPVSTSNDPSTSSITAESSPSHETGHALPEGVPIGTIVAYAGITDDTHVPANWMVCDGRSLKLTEIKYRELFHVVGCMYGGDGVTSFKIPDLRGVFIRGFDDRQGTDRIDPQMDRKLGSMQESCFASHSHAIGNLWLRSRPTNLSGLSSGGDSGAGPIKVDTSAAGNGSETRPVNIALNYIIKYR
jgi:microcystin-dependent protein